MSKLSTAERNRKNFEQARKVLFGTERIPGTDRERWTTAGTVSDSMTGTFVLGPYQFKINDVGAIKIEGIGTIGFIHQQYIRITNFHSFVLENFLQFKYNTYNSQAITLWSYKNGKFFVNYTDYSDRLEENLIPEFVNVEPNDESAFSIAYAQSKASIPSKKIEFTLSNVELGDEYNRILYEFSEPFPQGVIVYPNDARIMISSGPKELLIGLARYFTPREILSLLNNTTDTELCVLKIKRPPTFLNRWKVLKYTKKVKHNHMIPLSVIETITSAVDWLMHVLTGPDPRTYDSPSNMPHPDELKESSEPMFKHFKMERDEWGVMHLINSPKLLSFFVKQESTKTAELVRDETLLFLQGLEGEFADNYDRFSKGVFDEYEDVPHTSLEFKQALERLKQFTEHEFLGACVTCGHPEPQFRCSETDALYCNQECQTIDARQQKAKVSRVMREFAAGTLKSGSGERVTDRKQALAIAYSEARRL